MGKIYQVVAVYDNMTESFLAPTFVEQIIEAQRIFEYQINNIGLWHDNASDFDMYTLGIYDASTGEFTNDKHKIIKGTAVWKEKRKEQKNDIRSAENSET